MCWNRRDPDRRNRVRIAHRNVQNAVIVGVARNGLIAPKDIARILIERVDATLAAVFRARGSDEHCLLPGYRRSRYRFVRARERFIPKDCSRRGAHRDDVAKATAEDLSVRVSVAAVRQPAAAYIAGRLPRKVTIRGVDGVPVVNRGEVHDAVYDDVAAPANRIRDRVEQRSV